MGYHPLGPANQRLPANQLTGSQVPWTLYRMWKVHVCWEKSYGKRRNYVFFGRKVIVNRVPKSDASSFQPKMSHVTLNLCRALGFLGSWSSSPCQPWIDIGGWTSITGAWQMSYHLVMTNSLPWKDPPFLIDKPSISMGHLYHGYVSHNQRVYHLTSPKTFGNIISNRDFTVMWCETNSQKKDINTNPW